MILFSPFLKTTQILLKLCDYVLISSVIDGFRCGRTLHKSFTSLTLKKLVVWVSALVSEENAH